ncbi:MAG: shikimate dehydrogenase [Clostridia bacterium]|nr:shikimate dehydrogenase [Clostridia bacterium]
MQYGLIGEKLGHSFSKDIHTSFFGLDYSLKELTIEDVAPFLKDRNFKAINVTIPYKNTVIPFLDYIDDTAKKIGAVNTIVNEDGILKGYNTDFLGLEFMLEKSGIDFKEKNFLILGDGATSKTAVAVAESLKAKSIIRVSRKGTDGTVSYAQAKELKDIQIIINTTPVGMFPNLENTPIDIESFPDLMGVFDVVYNPLRTKLVLSALKKGIVAFGGLYMLVAQAVFAYELFVGTKIPRSKIDSIYDTIYKQKQNIVLIGMPGSGKTTVGTLLAENMGLEFIDTDSLIVEKHGDITEIFKLKGESGFRDIESKIIKDISATQGKVIATGGGAVLRAENIKALKQNGKIYFLDRPLESLQGTPDRPLSQNSAELKKRYDERYGIYCECADVRITENTTPKAAVRRIIDNENLSN